MNEWEIAAAVLGGALVPCALVCALASAGDWLVALELAGTLVVTILIVLAKGLRRQPFADLAVTLALLSLLAGLVIARLLERDL